VGRNEEIAPTSEWENVTRDNYLYLNPMGFYTYCAFLGIFVVGKRYLTPHITETLQTLPYIGIGTAITRIPNPIGTLTALGDPRDKPISKIRERESAPPFLRNPL
jgi:hypothetical protein